MSSKYPLKIPKPKLEPIPIWVCGNINSSPDVRRITESLRAYMVWQIYGDGSTFTMQKAQEVASKERNRIEKANLEKIQKYERAYQTEQLRRIKANSERFMEKMTIKWFDENATWIDVKWDEKIEYVVKHKTGEEHFTIKGTPKEIIYESFWRNIGLDYADSTENPKEFDEKIMQNLNQRELVFTFPEGRVDSRNFRFLFVWKVT